VIGKQDVNFAEDFATFLKFPRRNMCAGQVNPGCQGNVHVAAV
jgi:hypothetical protein